MSSRSSGVTWRFTRAGAPISTLPRGTRVPGETTAPAATRHSSSSTAPSRTMAPMPMRQWDLMWQPCRRAAWPTVTNSSSMVGVPRRLTWTMVPSWILVPRPTRMKFTSPRSTAVNQTLVSSASSTSPITWAEASTKAVGCSLGRIPRYGWSRPLLLRDGHDDLRLTRATEEAVEADDRRHQGGLIAVLGAEGAQGGDTALEAGVDGLQAIAGRPLEHHREQALPDLVLGNHQLLDAVTVEIHRERGGLDLVELALTALTRALDDQLHLDVAAAHNRGRAPDVLAVQRDLESVERVDVSEGAGVLAVDVGERRAHGPERGGHPHRLLRHDAALLDHDLLRLARREEVFRVVALGPERLLVALILPVEREEEHLEVVGQEFRLPVLGGDHEGVESRLVVIAVGHHLEDAVAVEVDELDRHHAPQCPHREGPFGLELLVHEPVLVDLLAVTHRHP